METIFVGAGTHLWTEREDLIGQLYDEATWISLAWGFHPSIQVLVPVEAFVGQDPDQLFDEYVDDLLRKRFQLGSEPAVSYTDIFRQLHLAGWHPATNVVNTAISPPGSGSRSSTRLWVRDRR